MKRAELETRINAAMAERALPIDDLRIQPGFQGLWDITLISQGFRGLSANERRQIVLGEQVVDVVDWLELMTPEEREWAGSLPIDSDLEELPLWPDALARGERSTYPARFPSELDEDLELPITTTFYSLRGGVGRSTALAYVGRILARRGRKVICVDMDLEAPGLAALFGKEDDVRIGSGLVHMLVEIDQGGRPDLADHLLRISDSDDLYCLPAGVPTADYARLLKLIEPSAWYREERNPLRELFALLRAGRPFIPDVILVDSRTGINELSGPLLFDLSDLAILTFFPHPQAYRGTSELVRALLSAKSRRSHDGAWLTPEPRFLVSPVPSSKAPEVAQRYRHRPLEWIADWIASVERDDHSDTSIIESDITHFVPYREVIATSDTVLDDEEVWRDYIPIADWIDRFIPTESEERAPASLVGMKAAVLEEIRFSAGTAELQEDFLETFVETDIVRRALQFDLPLVLGRKGTGKTAIFRKLFEDSKASTVMVLAPASLRREDWLLSAEAFRAVGSAIAGENGSWRQFWASYCALAVYLQWPGKSAAPEPDKSIPFEAVTNASELDVVRWLNRMLGMPSAGVLINDWLARLDAALDQPTLMLIDGLDTGFGSAPDDRDRRRIAIEGLFSFYTDRVEALRRLKLKIVLREDIWRQLRFENKSHLFGRSVKLTWGSQEDFFKVVVSQALRSASFRKLIRSTAWGGAVADQSIELWSETDVLRVWNLLVGERMKGGKTAFTRNWVWNRLADGNEDHSPRYLLQLFHEVSDWEKSEQQKNPYDKTIIRPRAFIAVLPSVSEEALAALKEEFPELQPLLDRLSLVGRTPLDAREVEGLQEFTSLAREVGLLGIYEGTDEKVERYKVPEIYRYGLSMTRKGQA